jgi:uncharacterized protein YdaL
MLQIVIVLFCAALLLPMQAQTAAERNAPTVATPNVFTFDEESPGKMPAGWGGGPANTISVDDSVAHSGKNSIRMVRHGESAGICAAHSQMNEATSPVGVPADSSLGCLHQ